jgi:hypothetical protein
VRTRVTIVDRAAVVVERGCLERAACVAIRLMLWMLPGRDVEKRRCFHTINYPSPNGGTRCDVACSGLRGRSRQHYLSRLLRSNFPKRLLSNVSQVQHILYTIPIMGIHLPSPRSAVISMLRCARPSICELPPVDQCAWSAYKNFQDHHPADKPTKWLTATSRAVSMKSLLPLLPAAHQRDPCSCSLPQQSHTLYTC